MHVCAAVPSRPPHQQKALGHSTSAAYNQGSTRACTAAASSYSQRRCTSLGSRRILGQRERAQKPPVPELSALCAARCRMYWVVSTNRLAQFSRHADSFDDK